MSDISINEWDIDIQVIRQTIPLENIRPPSNLFSNGIFGLETVRLEEKIERSTPFFPNNSVGERLTPSNLFSAPSNLFSNGIFGLETVGFGGKN